MKAIKNLGSSIWQAILLILLIAVPETFAEGKLELKPYVEVDVRTDSNYWKADDRDREVWTYSLESGLKLGYTAAKSQVLLYYLLQADWYDDQDRVPPGSIRASDLNFVGHELQLTAETQPTERLYIGLNEALIHSRDSAASEKYSNMITREKYTVNRITPQMFYFFGDTAGIGLKYQNEIDDYATATSEDSMENRGILDLIYTMNRYSSLDLEYQFWNRKYDQTTSDYTSNQIMLNYHREFMYFTLTLGAGFHQRAFDDASLDDIDAIGWKMEMEGQNPPKSDEKDQEIKSHTKIALSQNLNDLGYGQNYYTATRLDFEFGHLFLEKLEMTLAGYYQKSDYEKHPDRREDDSWSISGRIDYHINDLLTVGLETGFATRDSNLTSYDFDNTYILFRFRTDLDSPSHCPPFIP